MCIQFQELEKVEYDDVDIDGLIILEVSFIEPRTSVIDSQELCWSKE